MRILFLCSSLEDGKDGIGDYTRKLAIECQLQGASCILVAINDGYVSDIDSGFVGGIPFYRIPKMLPWKSKAEELLKVLNGNGPVDWISVQFVSYGFNAKGVVWNVIPFFRKLKNYKIHLMMHELWVAGEKQASFKMRILGLIQKQSIFSLINVMNPKIIHTSIPLYQKMLSLSGITSSTLPLFSNISHHYTNNFDQDEWLPKDVIKNRKHYVIGCLFGSIYHESWDMASLFDMLEREKRMSGISLIIVSIGKISYGKEFWDQLTMTHPNIIFVTLGAQDEKIITKWLNFVDFGIVTTPAIVAGKSGSCMAFLEHGVPVFCRENPLTFNFNISTELIDKRIIQIRRGDDFKLPKRSKPMVRLTNTAQTLVKTLNTSKI